MKILLANKFFFGKGGAETVLFQERDFLLRSGHKVVDFSMRDPRNHESAYGSYFVRRRDYRSAAEVGRVESAVTLVHSPEAVRKIEVLIEHTQPDVVHCHNIYHQLTPSIIGAAKKHGIPVVLTLHDYKLVCPTYVMRRGGQLCSDCIGGDFFNVIRHRCADGSFWKSALLHTEAVIQRHLGNYEKVDLLVAPSKFMRAAVSHRIPAEKVCLLYNGVDTSGIQASGSDEGYALYLGRLSPEKGIVTLLEAHAASAKDWPLVVAGTGPLEHALRRQYSKARFVGHLAGAPLQQTLARAAAVVVPSEWYENCPMSVLEAMARGKPVVASRIGGMPELVLDNETGLLFDAGNAEQLCEQLDRLMSDPLRRRRMGQNGLARAEQEFSLDRHCAGLMAIYQQLVRPDAEKGRGAQ